MLNANNEMPTYILVVYWCIVKVGKSIYIINKASHITTHSVSHVVDVKGHASNQVQFKLKHKNAR